MNVEMLFGKISDMNIETIVGVPDSTLKCMCSQLEYDYKKNFDNHYVTANEGNAIGIAVGEFLATGKPACVYMQNSGLGNIVNPLTSLAHKDVYGIPMLLIVGWRGAPGTIDEPQHKYMGKITEKILNDLDIAYSIIDSETSDEDLDRYFAQAMEAFKHNSQYALVIKPNSLLGEIHDTINHNFMKREYAIKQIVNHLQTTDLVVSTTGKISRELYEACNEKFGHHDNIFMAVGGMGHASMIAYQIAKRQPDRRIFCLDGDGAALMHLGAMAFIGQNPLKNLCHICLNNGAHESVGGMKTGTPELQFSKLADSMGYVNVHIIECEEALDNVLDCIRQSNELTFLEINVALGSRDDLGRPSESAEANKHSFMQNVGVIEE